MEWNEENGGQVDSSYADVYFESGTALIYVFLRSGRVRETLLSSGVCQRIDGHVSCKSRVLVPDGRLGVEMADRLTESE